MPAKAIKLFSCCLVLFLLSACDGYQKLLKSSDVNLKLTKANQYYDAGDYSKANELYESLMPVLKNTKNYAPLYYRYAYSFYYMKNYLEASYFFKNYTEYFPNSADAEECEYMHGVSLYKYSPKFSLDQTNTIKALDALQSFVNTHPNSKYVKDANSDIDYCRNKLERKEADAAKLYYNISQYKAAGIAYKSVMRNYPDSPNSDLYQFMIEKSFFKYAKASIEAKQEERYAYAIDAYHALADNYPHSQYLAEGEKIYQNADQQVKKIRNEHK